MSKPTSDAAAKAGVNEARELFTVPTEVCSAAKGFFASDNGGSAFRLPLRRTTEVKGGLGGEITLSDAEKLVANWVEALANGRILLFLSSVATVSIWRWAHGEPRPICLTKSSKSVVGTAPFSRLPETLPAAVFADQGGYEALRTHLANLDEKGRQQLSSMHKANVVITTQRDGGAKQQETTWLVYQRFDAMMPDILRTIPALAAESRHDVQSWRARGGGLWQRHGWRSIVQIRTCDAVQGR